MKSNILFKSIGQIVLIMSLFLAGCNKEELDYDCDACNQIKQKEVETTMINFVYNDISEKMSEEAESQLLNEKEILRHGHKFNRCGCKDNLVIYELWCGNGEMYHLRVELKNNDQFMIVGIEEAEFLHP